MRKKVRDRELSYFFLKQILNQTRNRFQQSKPGIRTGKYLPQLDNNVH